jgi:hypothetical protein
MRGLLESDGLHEHSQHEHHQRWEVTHEERRPRSYIASGAVSSKTQNRPSESMLDQLLD